MKTLKVISIFIVLGFALIGIMFTSVFVAMQFGWLNVRGSIDARNDSILYGNGTSTVPTAITTVSTVADAIGIKSTEDYLCTKTARNCHWEDTREWAVVAGGLTKDIALIERVSAETGVSPRLIAAVVAPEQVRFFTANREVFKRYFEPLKILGSLSKFSLGVSGIKQETAVRIEQHTKDITSPFYPGAGYDTLVAYPAGVDTDTELYNRLTNEKDHYYSYLYTALFIREILMQWERAGYDISDRPEIVATIFNIGFDSSSPSANPVVGGTTISVGGYNYTFGELAGLFYYSTQLSEFTP
jgi:hypothetical protein